MIVQIHVQCCSLCSILYISLYHCPGCSGAYSTTCLVHICVYSPCSRTSFTYSVHRVRKYINLHTCLYIPVLTVCREFQSAHNSFLSPSSIYVRTYIHSEALFCHLCMTVSSWSKVYREQVLVRTDFIKPACLQY